MGLAKTGTRGAKPSRRTENTCQSISLHSGSPGMHLFDAGTSNTSRQSLIYNLLCVPVCMALEKLRLLCRWRLLQLPVPLRESVMASTLSPLTHQALTCPRAEIFNLCLRGNSLGLYLNTLSRLKRVSFLWHIHTQQILPAVESILLSKRLSCIGCC